MTKDQPPDPAPDDLFRRLSKRQPIDSRYKLEGEVARGGMGSIIKIWDEDLRRHLAMKVVLGRGEEMGSGSTPSVDDKQLARFLEEAQVTGQLDHPGIVPVHEVGLDSDGRVYFTMKLVKGRDLKHIFDLVFQGKEEWTETRALWVILKVCEAMAYAHAKGVIHRDLKPANVMVGSFGEVYVMDWGLSRVLGRNDKHDIRIKPEFTSSIKSVRTERREAREETPDSPIVTMDGDVMGTPAYMSPEQARGEIDRLGTHSDVYSIGAILYHLLARQMPYLPPGARLSNRTILGLVVQGPPQAISSLRRDVPAELAAIVEKAMSREHPDRYANTLVLADDLRSFLEHRVVGAYETGAWAESKKWMKRNKALSLSLGAAITILIVGAITSTGLAKEARTQAAWALRLKESATARNDVVWTIQDLSEFKQQTSDAKFLVSLEEPQYDWWLRRARELVYGRPADENSGVQRKPSLEDHQALMAEIRLSALPNTKEQVLADRTEHPRASELQSNLAELTWYSRMLGESEWPSEKDVDAALDLEQLPTQAAGLSGLAEPLVGPDAPKFGMEIRGLCLAKRAMAAAANEESARLFRDTLAWALFRVGRFDEAINQMHATFDPAKREPIRHYADRVERLNIEIALWRDGAAGRRRDKLADETASLSELIASHRIWRFSNNQDSWWNGMLTKLESDLIELKAQIARVEHTMQDQDFRTRWADAIASIAHDAQYKGLLVEPQLDLLPIGRDASSHLWEFAHLPTGEAARRSTDGTLEMQSDTGLVMVLVPGGRMVRTTSDGKDGVGPATRRLATSTDIEGDVPAFFISKYEMTQAQWMRIAPQWFGDFHWKGYTLPAHSLSHDDCREYFAALRDWIEIPTLLQWEYAARGGMATKYWTGETEDSLQGASNIVFDSSVRMDARLFPIGTLRPNPFGLHDVYGNVNELCFSHVPPIHTGGHLSYKHTLRHEPVKGGHFSTLATVTFQMDNATSQPPNSQSIMSGVRPARGLRVSRGQSNESPADQHLGTSSR